MQLLSQCGSRPALEVRSAWTLRNQKERNQPSLTVSPVSCAFFKFELFVRVVLDTDFVFVNRSCYAFYLILSFVIF